ncbi:hypothetical protein V6N13_022052 [Hibiscus sabdariffa]
MSSKVGEAIGSKSRKSVATDLRDENGCLGEYLRVRVRIDSNKPLKRCTVWGRNIKMGQPRVCMAKYERLPQFCCFCDNEENEVRVALVENEKEIKEDAIEENDNNLVIAPYQPRHLTTPIPKLKSEKRSLKGKMDGRSLKKSKNVKSLSCPTSDGVEHGQVVVSSLKAPISVEVGT